MKPNFLAATLFAFWALLLAFPASVAAQTALIPGYGSGSATEETATNESDLADAIRTATEAGASVIVIDSSGNLVSAAGEQPESAPGGAGGQHPRMGGSCRSKHLATTPQSCQ